MARLQISDRAGYRRLCRELAAAAGPTPDFASAYSVVGIAVLAPDSTEDSAAVVRVAEGMANEAGGIRRRQTVALSTLGAALYRAGRYQEAVGRLNEASAAWAGGSPRDWVFLALAHHQLGNAAEARKWLAKVPAYAPADGALDWYLLAVEFLRREVATAIGP